MDILIGFSFGTEEKGTKKMAERDEWLSRGIGRY
jgi:hypothetical protein